jgi:hypothetical protein
VVLGSHSDEKGLAITEFNGAQGSFPRNSDRVNSSLPEKLASASGQSKHWHKTGRAIVIATLSQAAAMPTSHTGRYLKQVLRQHPPEADAV